MKILAFDTSVDFFSIALFEDEKLLAQSVANERGKHAELLICEIEKILHAQKICYEDLDLIAATKGPGSFTGTRIALTAAKVLHLASKLPLILLTSLEVLAYKHKDHQGKIFSALPSGVNDFFCQEFFSENGEIKNAAEPRIISLEELEEIRKKKEFLLCELQKNEALDPKLIALLALKKFHRGESKNDLKPVYLRDARVGERKK